MTTSEHLQRIKAKCEQLLKLASKRTPGKWKNSDNEVVHLFRGHLENHLLATKEDNDAAFIASCAGPAEAGWRATIAAIEQIQSMRQDTPTWEFVGRPMQFEIIAAWPEELL